MKKTAFSLTAAALLLAAFTVAPQAAPIAPLAGISSNTTSQVTKAYWHRHRHCWRGRWGRLHCGW